MADRIQLDGRTYVPIAEAASLTNVQEGRIRALASSGTVLLRAIGKKIYVDLEGLQTALHTQAAPAPAPTNIAMPAAPPVQQTMPPRAVVPQPVVVPAAPVPIPKQPLPAEIPVPVALQKAVPPADPPAMKMAAAQQLVHPVTAPVPVQSKPAARSLPPSAPLVPERHHATSSGELAAMSIPVPLPVSNVAPPAPAPAPVASPVAAFATAEPTSSVTKPVAVPPVPAHAAPQAAAVPPVVQPKPTTAATAPSAPSVLPKMILPPKEMMSRRTSFATSAAAVAAFVFVVGGGAAAYSKAPVIAQMMRQAGEQIAAAAGFYPSATYTLSAPPENHLVPDSPSTYQANAAAATFPGAGASSTQPIYYVYNYPVIERIVEEVRYISADSPQDWQAQLDALYQRIQSQIQALNINTSTNFAQQYQVIAHTNNIDQLAGVRISDSTFTGGTITGSTLTDIASLDVDGSTTLGSLSAGDVTSSGSGTFSGAGTFSYLVASSTSATSTFNGALLATRAPTVPHTFGSWNTGTANSAWWDAALVINPASAVADSNLFSAAVNGDVKFLIDAEGDVFVNNLTSVGSVTLSTTSASTFTVEGNTTLGDSITDTTTINGSLIVTGTTTASTVSGKFGVGTSTPWGRLSVSAASNASDPQFVVASSSAIGLILDRNGYLGVGTSSPSNRFEVAGNTFLGGNLTVTGSTNFSGGASFAGLSSFNLASTSQLSVFQRAYFGGSATTTIDSTGAITVSSTAANTFPYASTTALTVSGTAHFAGSGIWNSSGNVGIGTTTPNGKLNIVANTSPLLVLDSTNGLGGYSTFRLSGTDIGYIGSARPVIGVTSGNDDIAIGAVNDFIIGAGGSGGTERLRVLASSGNVGIGTTSPLRRLSVEQAIASAQFAVAYDTTRVTEIQTDSSGDVVIDPSGNDVRINDDNLWVCASGSCPSGTPSGTGNLVVETRIGVASSTPVTGLVVNGITSYKGLNSAAVLAGNLPAVVFEDTTNGGASAVQSNAGRLDFWTRSANTAFDSSDRRMVIDTSGNVGIGTTSPSAQLAISEELFVGAGGASTMGTATSTFYGDIRIIGKLDVSTIDPVYTISGTKYATYGHSTVGIKEEVVLKVTPTVWDAQKQMYAHVIDFDSLDRGSDLWLFYQVSDFGKNWQNLIASLSPAFDGRTYYEENIAENSLTIYASDSKPVSLRLIASRYDFTKWGNLRPDQDGDTAGTHVIEEK